MSSVIQAEFPVSNNCNDRGVLCTTLNHSYLFLPAGHVPFSSPWEAARLKWRSNRRLGGGWWVGCSESWYYWWSSSGLLSAWTSACSCSLLCIGPTLHYNTQLPKTVCLVGDHTWLCLRNGLLMLAVYQLQIAQIVLSWFWMFLIMSLTTVIRVGLAWLCWLSCLCSEP